MNFRRLLIFTVLAAMACKPQFNAGAFGKQRSALAAAMKEYNAKHWENATRAFERLTTELSPRDPRIALAYFYLAKCAGKDAAITCSRRNRTAEIYELLPQDTLADDALLASGVAYFHMWRKPVLDAEYGEDALTQFQTLQGLYPDSPLMPRAHSRWRSSTSGSRRRII